MRQLFSVVLGVTLAGLASAMGAWIGFLATAAGELIYGFLNPTFFWKYDDPADQWVYDAYCKAGGIVGTVAGILLGIWLARRVLTVWASQ